MTTRSVIFTADEVRATLEGRKTQFRRLIKPQPEGKPASLIDWARPSDSVRFDHNPTEVEILEKSERLNGRVFPFRRHNGHLYSLPCPFGQPGGLLRVRETWQCSGCLTCGNHVHYRATEPDFRSLMAPGWRSSSNMPQWASRIMLRLKSVRVERNDEGKWEWSVEFERVESEAKS